MSEEKKTVKCFIEKKYFLNPEQVSDRIDELIGLIFSQFGRQLSAEFVAEQIGYIKAHIERDAEEWAVAYDPCDHSLQVAAHHKAVQRKKGEE